MLLLHISDLHLRRDEVGTAMDPNFHLRSELVRDAEEMCGKLGAPAAVLISGDLAYSGHAEESNYYDSFNMMRRKDVSGYGSEFYVYNANDERIAVVSGCTTSTQPNCNNALVTVSARDGEGKVLRQFDVPYPWFSTQAWSWVEDYVYREGQLLAAERPAAEGGRRHFHLDHLGSPRLVTGPSGQQIAAHDYYPFGVEITPLRQETMASLDREDPMKFTGHERDFNIGTLTENSNYNDYMRARFATPQWGRFLSVDPGPVDPKEPQSWNRFAFLMNNPMNRTDPTGKCGESAEFVGPRLPCSTLQKAANSLVTSLIDAADNSWFGKQWHGAETEDINSMRQGSAEAVWMSLTLAFLPAEARESETVDTTAEPAIRSDVQIFGGRSGQNIKDATAPENSIVRGSEGRIYQTNDKGQIISDITKQRVKEVRPGIGFGRKRPPTEQELGWLNRMTQEIKDILK